MPIALVDPAMHAYPAAAKHVPLQDEFSIAAEAPYLTAPSPACYSRVVINMNTQHAKQCLPAGLAYTSAAAGCKSSSAAVPASVTCSARCCAACAVVPHRTYVLCVVCRACRTKVSRRTHRCTCRCCQPSSITVPTSRTESTAARVAQTSGISVLSGTTRDALTCTSQAVLSQPARRPCPTGRSCDADIPGGCQASTAA
jgi:hypothetical protein